MFRFRGSRPELHRSILRRHSILWSLSIRLSQSLSPSESIVGGRFCHSDNHPLFFFSPNLCAVAASALIMATVPVPVPVPVVPAPILEEKAPSSSLSFLTDNAITSVINNTYASLAAKREAMGLTNPGTVESIDREVKREVLLSNYMFSGLRCDLQKIFSVNPLFRLQHGFAMGSQALPPWQMMAIYGTNRVSVAIALSSL